MYWQWSLIILSTLQYFKPQILNKVASLPLSFEYLSAKTKIVLSIVSTSDRPYESLFRYYVLLFLLYDFYLLYYAIYPDYEAYMYQFLSQKNLYMFSNRFSINLYSSLSLNTSETERVIQQKILRQFQSRAFCSSTSSPLSPFLLNTANRYLSPPSLMIPLTACSSSFLSSPTKELAIHFKAMAEYQFFILIKEIMRQLPFIQSQVFLFWGRIKFISKIDRHENRLLRNYFSSQLVGSLFSYDEIVQRSTSIPENWLNNCCDFYELDNRPTRISELAYLLSSMILCLTTKLGIILLARYSNNCLSSPKITYTSSVTFINISTSFRHFSPASYSSMLFYSSIRVSIPTSASTQEFSTSHTIHLQQISKSWSFWGSSQSRSQSISMTSTDRSMLGWVSSLTKGCDMWELIINGMCSWESSDSCYSKVCICSQGGQNFSGSSGYFILKLVFCYKHYISCLLVFVRAYRLIVNYYPPAQCYQCFIVKCSRQIYKILKQTNFYNRSNVMYKNDNQCELAQKRQVKQNKIKDRIQIEKQESQQQKFGLVYNN